MSLRLGRLAAVALSGLILVGCAPLKVSSYAERGNDLTRYHTYGWAPDDQLVTGDPRLDNNPFFLERLQGDADRHLASKGLEKLTAGSPDLILHYHASVTQRLDVTGSDQRYGQCDDCKAEVYDAGTVLFDFVDARTNKLVWRGWAEGSLDGVIDNQAWMEEKIDQTVARIMEKLPIAVHQ